MVQFVYLRHLKTLIDSDHLEQRGSAYHRQSMWCLACMAPRHVITCHNCGTTHTDQDNQIKVKQHRWTSHHQSQMRLSLPRGCDQGVLSS